MACRRVATATAASISPALMPAALAAGRSSLAGIGRRSRPRRRSIVLVGAGTNVVSGRREPCPGLGPEAISSTAIVLVRVDVEARSGGGAPGGPFPFQGGALHRRV